MTPGVPQWSDYIKPVVESGAPDTAYEAQRWNYWEQYVQPEVLKAGENLAVAKRQFKEATERPGKSSMPRLAVAGAAALEGLTAPITGTVLPKYKEPIKQLKEEAMAEATRQGISPTLPAMAGEMLGQAPYWVSSLGAVHGMAAGGMQKVLNMAAGAVIQGTYDAAKADDGARVTSGVEGAALGAAGVAAFEVVMPGLWRSLKTAHKLPDEVAKAVEATTNGSATEAQQTMAATALQGKPEIQQTIAQQTQAGVAASKAKGVPKQPPVLGPKQGNQITISMMGADGKPYKFTVGTDNMDAATERLKQHLARGGEVTELSGGDTRSTNQLLKLIDAPMKPKQKVTPRGKGKSEIAVDEATVDQAVERATSDTLTIKLRDADGKLQEMTLSPDQKLEPVAQVAASLIDDGATLVDISGVKARKLDFMKSMQAQRRSPAPESVGAAPEGAGVAPSPASKVTPPAPAASASAEVEHAGNTYRKLPEQGWMNTTTGRLVKSAKTITALEERLTAAPLADIKPAGAELPPDWVITHEPVPADLPEEEIVPWLVENYGMKVPEAIQYEAKWITPERAKRPIPAREGQEPAWYDRAAQNLANKGIGKGPQQRLMAQVPPSDQLYIREDGMAINTIDGTIHQDARSALEDITNKVNGAPLARSVKETPLGARYVHDTESMLGNDNIVGGAMMEGGKPRIDLLRDGLSPETLWHEWMHAHIMGNDLDRTFGDLYYAPSRRWSLQQQAMWRGMAPDLQAIYNDRMHLLPEETYVYAAAAVRTGNEETLGAMIKGDTSRERVMQWIADTTDYLYERNASLPDSPHKRAFERKLGDVLRRSTGDLEAMGRATADVHGGDIDVNLTTGRLRVRDEEGVWHHFNEREEAAKFLEERWAEPSNAPNLIDESYLSPEVPRLAARTKPHSPARPPNHTDPPALAPGEREPRIGLASLASGFFRPTYAWVDTVARQLGKPELYNAFRRIDEGIMQRDAWIEHWETPLKEALVGKSLMEAKYNPGQQVAMLRYMQAAPEWKAKIVQTLNITPEMIADIDRLRVSYLDPLKEASGIDFDHLIQAQAKMFRDFNPELLREGPDLTKREKEFLQYAYYKGEIDPSERNLLKLAHVYMRLAARDKFVATTISDARKMLRTKIGDTDIPVYGNYTPQLERYLDFMQGQPDYTQRVVDGVIQSGINLANKTFEKLNKVLPFNIDPITDAPRDILGRWILFSYAGSLGLRPMVPLRDGMQLFLTTYPLLGGKYLGVGLKKSFAVAAERDAAEAWQIADKYGALMKHSDLQNLYSGGYEEMAAGSKTMQRLTKASEAMLKPLQWSNNSNRLISFWGHAEKAFDALREELPKGLTPEVEKVVTKKTGMIWMDDLLKEKYMEEVRKVATDPSKWRDLSYRMSKDLVDLSQWNYRRGASPGLYRYALGRLFGQYGTWPLNYIEFARRLVTKGDAGDKAAAITRLAVMHGAMLSAGEQLGIDTGQWVFTQPMAYGGSPIYQAVSNVPGSMDFETYRGSEARRSIVRPFVGGLDPVQLPTMIPGALEFNRLYKSFATDSPTFWADLFGFQPLKPNESEKGIHALVPGGPQ